jgi:capsid protein
MEAGITSRRKVVEATGYDVEEVDRKNPADAAPAMGLGLRSRTRSWDTQVTGATSASTNRTDTARPFPAPPIAI